MSEFNTKSIEVPIFGGAVHFVNNIQDYQKIYKKITGKTSSFNADNTVCGFCQSFDNIDEYFIVVLDDSQTSLVHECAHAVFKFCKSRGIKVENGMSNETYCYLIGYLFNEGKGMIESV
jgi:hypothetical protein